MVKLDKCVGSCNIFHDLFKKSMFFRDLNLRVFNMITGIIESKTLKSIYHKNVHVNLMVKNLIQIRCGIMINVDTSAKKIIFRTLLIAVAKMLNILQVLLTIQ